MYLLSTHTCKMNQAVLAGFILSQAMRGGGRKYNQGPS